MHAPSPRVTAGSGRLREPGLGAPQSSLLASRPWQGGPLPARPASASRRAACRGPARRAVRPQAVRSAAAAAPGKPPGQPEEPSLVLGEATRRNVQQASAVLLRVGRFSFWSQLSLSVVSAGIWLFSVAFTAQNGPKVSLYLTLFGIVAGFFSTFWAFGYVRTARSLARCVAASARRPIRKAAVLEQLQNGAYINLTGLASTLLGLQATVGLLVAKTLTNATANPFLSGGAGSYSPVLALDVFLVQAATNTLLSHFLSLLCGLWLYQNISSSPT